MKLKKYLPNEARGGTPGLNISKNGAFQFNLSATREIEELKSQIKAVSIFKDEEDPTSWYLVFQEEGEFVLRYYKNKGAIFNSSGAAKTIKKATRNDQKKGLSCRIGPPIEHDGNKVRPLLIKMGDQRP